MSSQRAKVFILDGARTPFGKFGGALSKVSPVDLSVEVSRGLINRNAIDPSEFDHVIYSNVIPSTSDTLYGARHIALKLGMPEKTPGYTVNRLCGSGIQAMWEAAKMIELGLCELVLVTGSENMSQSPHLTYGARFGTKYGSLKTDDLLLSTLTDQMTNTPMGITAEKLGSESGVKRAECDLFSMESHLKAKKAYEASYFKDEIIPMGNLTEDEHLRRDISIADLEKLRSTFVKDGLVTAGSASGIVDGAASVIICSEKYLKKSGIKALSKVIDFHVVGVDPSIMGVGPVPAINELLEKNNLKKEEIDFFEINEAFSAQAVSCIKRLEIPMHKVNVWGGAVALGHPLGASGVRIALTASNQLKLLDKKKAVASACIGGGQGIAVLLESVNE